MSQLTKDRESFAEIGGGSAALDNLTVLAAELLFVGGMQARDYNGEIQMASDSAGLRVLGANTKNVDNTDDGALAPPARHGIWPYYNSSTYPVTRNCARQVCYVADDNTVAMDSTHRIAAGLVHDVTADGRVWVDQRPEALALARMLALPKLVSVTDDLTVTAAQAFQGNCVFACDKATGLTLTLPSAAPGYRIGVQRLDATAAHDVVVQAAAGDTVRGSAAAGTATNDTDAQSDVLYLEAVSATAWVDAHPLAKDRAEWAPGA